MSLTDDWKAGKLDIGQYYVAYKGGRYGIENLIETYDYYGFDNNSANIIVEVLAPAPSYEELQEMKSQIKHLKDLQQNEDKEVERLTGENEALKIKVAEFEEENRKAHSDKNWCNARAKNLLDKNKSFMGLLKECKDELSEFDNNNYPVVQSLLTRIKTVISESEE